MKPWESLEHRGRNTAVGVSPLPLLPPGEDPDRAWAYAPNVSLDRGQSVGLTDEHLERIRKVVEEAEKRITQHFEPEEVCGWVARSRALLDEVDRRRPPLQEGAARVVTRNPPPAVVEVVSRMLQARPQNARPLRFSLTWLVEPSGATNVRLTIKGLDPKPRFKEEGAPDDVLRRLGDRASQGML